MNDFRTSPGVPPRHPPYGRPPARRWARVLLGLAAAVVLACGDDVTGPPDTTTPPVLGSCEGTGTTHAGSVRGEVWDSSGNPHRVPETIAVEGRLTIGPGVVVCLGAGAALRVSAEVLDVRGTEEDPVLLTPADPSARWGGIMTGGAASPDTIRLEHVRLEGAEWGVRTEFDDQTLVLLDHAHFRQIEDAAVSARRAEIRHSVIDTACFVCGAAVSVGGFVRQVVFEESVIRGSGGIGLSIGAGSTTDLLGGRIEGSAGTGLTFSRDLRTSQRLGEARPLRITGGSSYPIDIPAAFVERIWPTEEDLDSLKGNVRDTLLVELPGSFTVRPGLPWSASRSLACCNLQSDITIEAGGTLAVRGVDSEDRVSLTARGTPEYPVTIVGEGKLFTGFGTGTSIRGSHVRIRGVSLVSDSLQLEGFLVEDAAVTAVTEASYLRDGLVRRGAVSLIGSTMEDVAVVAAPATGVTVRTPEGSRSILRNCDVRDSRDDGVEVSDFGPGPEGGGTARIEGCNLFRNGGLGVRHLGAGAVDARGNWWGDAEGPLGPEGDGVSGTVDFGDFLSAPAERERPAVARVTVSPISLEVPRGWVVQTPAAEGFDSAGLWVPTATFTWRSSDDSVLEPVPGPGGLWRGLALGEASVVVTAEGSPSASATARVEVTDGPAAHRWSRQEGVCPARDLWGTSATDVYAICEGTISRFDGVAWTDVTPSAVLEVGGPSWEFVAMSGTGPDDVYLLTRYAETDRVPALEWNRVLRFDGAGWRWLGEATSRKARSARSIYAAGPEAVWIGGVASSGFTESGVEFYDGSEWSWSYRTRESCWDVRGFGPREVYVGCGSDVFRFDGSTWSSTGFSGRRSEPPLWNAGGSLFASGDSYVGPAPDFELLQRLWRYDDGTWSEIDPVPEPPSSLALSLAGNDPNDIVAGALGDRWTVLHAYDGSGWHPVFVDAGHRPTRAVFVDGDDAFVVAGSAVLRGVR